MDTDYMFYTQKREKKEKGEKSSEKKMKGMMPMNSSKQRQIRPECHLAQYAQTAENSKLHTKIYLSHIKNIKRQGVGEQQKRKENPDDQTKTDWWWRSPKSMAQYASIAQTLCSHSCTLQCVLFPQQHHTASCTTVHFQYESIVWRVKYTAVSTWAYLCKSLGRFYITRSLLANVGECVCSVPFCV